MEINLENMTDGDLAALRARIDVENNVRYEKRRKAEEKARADKQREECAKAQASLERLQRAHAAGFDLSIEIRKAHREINRLSPWVDEVDE